ncbi:hypothetical protein D3C76_1636660 [compost metagenome]
MIETLEEDAKIVIDVVTGEVLHMEHLDLTIQKLERFIKAARNRYNKFMTSKAVQDFID